MNELQICGTGWATWEEQSNLLAGWRAVWSDLDGAHLAEPPTACPPGATHLWAWSGDRWARTRIDEGEAVIGFLHPSGDCPRGASDCAVAVVSEPVTAASWAELHVNVGDLRDVKWRLIDAIDGVAASFVREAE